MCGKRILKNSLKNKLLKLRDYCQFRNAAHSVCNLNFSVPSEITVAFHNS